MTRLCVPITGETSRQMIADIETAANAGAEMIELRLDYLSEWNNDSMKELMNKARQFGGEVIATCRITDEGGNYKGDENERITLFELAGQSGADYIDVEYETWKRSSELREKIRALCSLYDSSRSACKLILSKHNLESTPTDLNALFSELTLEPCHVVKLACKARTITDSVRMLEALKQSAAIRPTIGLCMGETGILTRVLSKKFGALLTFASLESGRESAPGQISIEQMRSLYRWEAINAETLVYGVIGCPVAHSMSPAIHNAAFEAIDYNGVYLPMRVEHDYESFADFIDGCRSLEGMNLRGCSVTIPHKKHLLQYVEQHGGDIEPLALRIGAANTLCIEPTDGESVDRLGALNTDYRGALDALCEGIGCDRKRLGKLNVAVLGAGGVSRAIVAGLHDCGSKVSIYNRTASKAQALADEFDCTARPWQERDNLQANAVINCTSIGMWPKTENTPLHSRALSKRTAVFDTVYNPIETRLLHEARRQGCKTVDGVAMFVNQAVAQFERWTGRKAPVEIMRQVVTARLSS
ncbi:MAG: shikimate dehydrogenase [Planctomycetota bacterium]|nr:MAG: shikimate dehydrogenase [Planctomycetota bacterium]